MHALSALMSAARRLRRLRPFAAHSDGQSMVEFALVLPIFLILIIGLMEFSVALSAMLNINYASRDAALIAAEAGSDDGADCVILSTIDADVNSPSDKGRITQVRIFRSSVNGAELAVNSYVRSATNMTCTLPDATVLAVPYAATSSGYPVSSRCAVLAGCPPGDPGRPSVDTIGVSITYAHQWITPLANLVTLGGSGFSFERTNAMRMEPEL